MICCCMVFFCMYCLLKAFPNCHKCAPLSTTCDGSNYGSSIFIWFEYPMANSLTHSLESLYHFLLTVKDRPCYLDQRNVIILQVGRCNILAMGKWKNKPTLQHNDLEPTPRPIHVKVALHVVCVCLVHDLVDGDLVLINPAKPVIKGEFGQDLKEGSNSKPSTPIMVLKPVSIEDTPLLQHHNLIFNLQDTLNHN